MTRRTRRVLYGTLGMLLAASAAQAQTTTLFDEYGPTSRSGAMGNAFTGISDGAAAAYFNPGGLGFAENETYIGWRYSKAHLSLDYSDPAEDDLYFSAPGTRIISAGSTGALATDELIEEFPWMADIRWGGTALISFPEINSFQAYADETTPYFFRYDTRPSALSITIAFAWKNTDWMSIGGGVMITVNTLQTGDARIRLTDALTQPEGDPTSGLDVDINVATNIELSPTAGVLFKLPVPGMNGRPLNLGLSYRGEIANVFGAGPTTNVLGDVDDTGVFNPILNFPEGVLGNFVGFAPAQYSAGIGVRPLPELLIGADVIYKNWSEFTSFIKIKPEPPFEDTVVLRLGAEYTVPFGYEHWFLALKAVDLRLGYGYEPTPNPTLNSRYNLLDSTQHILSGGLGINLRFMDAAMFRLDAIFRVHYLEDRSTDNEGDPKRGPYTIGGEVIHAGFEGRVDW